MRLGIMHTIVRAASLEQAFQAAADVGAEGVEIYYGSVDQLSQDDCAEKLLELSRRHNLAIPSLALGFLTAQPSLIGSPEIVDDSLRMIARGLDLASAVGAGVVLVPCGGKNAIESDSEMARAADALARCSEHAEQTGVVVGVETNLAYAQEQYLLHQAGNADFVKIYYDTGNVAARKLDPATGIRQLGLQAIAQVHFKDLRMVEGEPPDYAVSLGGGSVDFQAVVQSLRAVGYDGWIVLETPPAGEPVDSARSNLQFARGLLDH